MSSRVSRDAAPGAMVAEAGMAVQEWEVPAAGGLTVVGSAVAGEEAVKVAVAAAAAGEKAVKLAKAAEAPAVGGLAAAGAEVAEVTAPRSESVTATASCQ